MVEIKQILKYSKSMRVLYVEDNEDVRNSTLDLLSDFFSTIDTAEDGQIGLDTFKQARENELSYDLIISDINMPNMNGIDMIREIKALQSDQAIIVISAHNESSYLFDLINIGVSSFVLKPLSLEQFMQTLHDVTRNVYEHKFTRNYYRNIELLNYELEQKNDELNNSLRLTNTLVSKEMLKKVQRSDLNEVNEISSENEYKDELIKFEKISLQSILIDKKELNSAILDILDAIFHDKLSSEHLEKLSEHLSFYHTKMASFKVFENFCLNVDALNNIVKDARLLRHKDIDNIFLLVESFIHMSNKYIENLQLHNLETLALIEANLNDDLQNITSLFEGKYTKENLSFFDLLK